MQTMLKHHAGYPRFDLQPCLDISHTRDFLRLFISDNLYDDRSHMFKRNKEKQRNCPGNPFQTSRPEHCDYYFKIQYLGVILVPQE